VIGPKGVAQLIPSDRPPGILQQQNEDLKGLILKFDSEPMPSQFTRTDIDLERAEP
jgi:hypothetical protein